MAESASENEHEKEELVQLAVARAANFYDTHKLCCSEAVIVTLNQGFRGDLSPQAALQLGSGFCHGMGGAGCTCGALSGAVASMGVLLGPHGKDGCKKKKFRAAVREMHDRFRARFRATCCRILSKKVKHDKQAHLANCLQLTKGGAEIAVRLLLEARPELVNTADRHFLAGREGL